MDDKSGGEKSTTSFFADKITASGFKMKMVCLIVIYFPLEMKWVMFMDINEV